MTANATGRSSPVSCWSSRGAAAAGAQRAERAARRLRLPGRRPAGHDRPGQGRRAVPGRRVSVAAVSGRGVHAQVVGVDKPLTPTAAHRAARQGRRNCRRTAKTPADRQELAAIRMQDRRLGPAQRRTRCSPRSSTLVRSPSTPTPSRARASCGCGTPLGLSNPLVVRRRPVPGVRGEGREGRAGRRRAGDHAAGHRQRAPHPRRRRSRCSSRCARRSSTCPATWIAIASRRRKGQDLVVHRQRARPDAVPGRRRARLVPGDADALRRGGPRGRLRRRLPLPARPGRSTSDDPGRRRVRARDQGRDLPRPRGLRLPHRHRRAAVRHQHLPARRAGRVEDAPSRWPAGTCRPRE